MCEWKYVKKRFDCEWMGWKYILITFIYTHQKLTSSNRKISSFNKKELEMQIQWKEKFYLLSSMLDSRIVHLNAIHY